MIETLVAQLPHGITLHCRVAGARDAPVLLFVHGFPEAAFAWDELLVHFGDRYRCIAPNLRGYRPSSSPPEVSAYRVKHLVADLLALMAQQSSGPVEAVVAHDWGGALAWSLAAQHPQALKRLVIINSPHPALFLRELQTNPVQQATSAYMDSFCRADAEARLSDNDFALLWPLLAGDWLTEALKEKYRALWRAGLTGALNYYRASPLRPPEGPDSAVMALQLPPEQVSVRLPTRVVWGEADAGLPLSLLDGLEAFVPDLTLTRVPSAGHWIVHEQPGLVAREIEAALAIAPR